MSTPETSPNSHAQADMVLVTGISGFLGGHVALELLRQGYRVRGSVRNLNKADKVRATLAAHGADLSRVEFVALDLLSDTGWEAAVRGCRYVQHVASPFVLEQPKDRNELIRPAVEGTTRAIKSSLAAGVERIVVTSSIAAIVYGHAPNRPAPFTEADWTNLAGPLVPAYQESKTRAEQAAWQLVESYGARDRLAVINPSAIMGPLLDDDPGTSGQLLMRLLDGSVPGTPKMTFSVIDVRDVAAAQVAAMQQAEAGGKRFILSDSEMSMFEMAETIRKGYQRPGIKVPRFELPSFMVRIVGLFDRQIRDNVAELDNVRACNGDAGRRLIGRGYIPAPEAILATVRTIYDNGIMK
jgi:nucleoside-diphosphate-sugar epimerase